MSESSHDWDAEQLRHAIWLALPPSAAGSPSLVAAAATVGVTVRSVQRWFAGTTTPSPDHAIALRAALLPSPGILARQRDERSWAVESSTVIAAPRGRGVDPRWRSQGWHKPHLLRILHHQQWGISRVAVGLASPAKPYYPPRGWSVESSVTYPHRPAALVAKHEKLDEVAGRRIRVRAELVDTGRHECWLTSKPSPGQGANQEL